MRRWRQHAAFSMGLARWSAIQRCAYCDVLPPSLGIPWAVEGYDGVADIWFRGDATPADPEDRARLSADEIETFSDYVSAFALHTREVIVKPGGGTVKATLFVRNTASGDPGGFAARWARHADRVLSLPRADLVGGSNNGNKDANAFTYRFVGGIDSAILPHIDWRVFDFSYGGGATQLNNDVHMKTLTTGLVLRF